MLQGHKSDTLFTKKCNKTSWLLIPWPVTMNLSYSFHDFLFVKIVLLLRYKIPYMGMYHSQVPIKRVGLHKGNSRKAVPNKRVG